MLASIRLAHEYNGLLIRFQKSLSNGGSSLILASDLVPFSRDQLSET